MPTKGPLQLVAHDFLREHLLKPRAVTAHPMSDALQILPANSYANYLISRLIYFLRHRGIVFSALPCLPEAAGPQGWEEAAWPGLEGHRAVVLLGTRGWSRAPPHPFCPSSRGALCHLRAFSRGVPMPTAP